MAIERVTSVSVRVSRAAGEKLERLSQATGRNKIDLLDQALAMLDEQLFWAAMDAGYAEHGAALHAELATADGALLDGLDGIPA